MSHEDPTGDAAPAVTAPRPRRRQMWRAAPKEAVVGLAQVFWHAVQLLWGYWPILLAIAFAGAALREGALWAAVEVSDYQHEVGVMILALAPLAAAGALIAMLRAVRDSMPSLVRAGRVEAPEDPTTHRERRLIDVIASVVVPFLAIYESYGFLQEDMFRFVNAAAADEFLNNPDIWLGGQADIERATLLSGQITTIVVLVALLLRHGLSMMEGRWRWPPLGFLGAYVEVIYLTCIAWLVTTYLYDIRGWIESRRLAQGIADVIDTVVSWTGPLESPIDAVLFWAWNLLDSIPLVIVVPAAWLTVGAVVYGHQLAPAQPARPRPSGTTGVRRAVAHVWRMIVVLLDDAKERFGAMTTSIRQFALAGVAPMLMFALAFLLARKLEDLLHWIWRDIVGPQPVDTWLAFSPHADTVIHAIGTVVVVCLLAAAIDRVMQTIQAPTQQSPVSADSSS